MKQVGFAHTAFTTADVYERGRSGYPSEAVGHLVQELRIDEESTVVDLAAGTGKFTRLLVPTGARVVAVEPVAEMRGQLAKVVPEALPVAAAAEQLPLATSSVDALTVAQAFHWFEADRALAEIHRVLKPGGRLGLVWNRADTSVDWVARLSSIRSSREAAPKASAKLVLHRAKKKAAAWVAAGRSSPANGGDPAQPSWVAKCRRAFASTTLFTPLDEETFRHGEEMDADRLVDWVASFSPFSRLSEGEQARVLGEVRKLAAGLPPRFSFPYRTDVFWSTAK
ncbi:MAG: class I SAM-dependent methyltransferase [Acidimicrobiales bacterium]